MLTEVIQSIQYDVKSFEPGDVKLRFLDVAMNRCNANIGVESRCCFGSNLTVGRLVFSEESMAGVAVLWGGSPKLCSASHLSSGTEIGG